MTARAILLSLLSLAALAAFAQRESVGVLRVGTHDFAPLVSEAARHSLFDRLVREIARSEDWQLEFVHGDLETGIERLNAGELDLLMGVPFLERYASRADLSNEAVFSTWAQLYRRQSGSVESLPDLGGKTVGVVRDTPYNHAARHMLEQMDIAVRFAEFKTNAEMLDALQQHWVDAVIMDRLQGQRRAAEHRLESTPIVLSPIEFGFAVARGQNRELLRVLDYHLQNAKQTPDSFYYGLVNEILAGPERFLLPAWVKWVAALMVPVIAAAGISVVLLRIRVRVATRQLSEKNRALREEVATRQRAEKERRYAESRLRQSQKLEALGTLAGGVAHEIDNPINSIMGYAELILDEVGDGPSVARFASEIHAETERVADIVKNLLSFARPDEQRYGDIFVGEIVDSTLSLVRTVLCQDQIAVRVEVPPSLPFLHCCPQQIRQVLMNLITNARDALNEKWPGHHDEKTLRVRAEITEEEGQSWLRLTVEDQGVGISPDDQEKLFEPFYTTKHPGKGTGLGLSISHRIVTNHGGRIQVESALGQWTRFHVDLPVSSEQTDQAVRNSAFSTGVEFDLSRVDAASNPAIVAVNQPGDSCGAQRQQTRASRADDSSYAASN